MYREIAGHYDVTVTASTPDKIGKWGYISSDWQTLELRTTASSKWAAIKWGKEYTKAQGLEVKAVKAELVK